MVNSAERLDVVHQTIPLPLSVDFCALAQREAIQARVVAQIREDRFHGGEAPPFCARPSGVSSCAFMRAAGVSRLGVGGERRNATLRTGVVAGVRGAACSVFYSYVRSHK